MDSWQTTPSSAKSAFSIQRKPLASWSPASATASDHTSQQEKAHQHGSGRANPTRRRGRKNVSYQNQGTWTLELVAATMSLASVASAIVVLTMYDGKPLKSWTFPISINVIVSVLAALSKGTLAFATSACLAQEKWNWFSRKDDKLMVFDRFEEASRGPWGSVRFLWWMKLKHWITLGALTTVVLVTFEPFLQAIVDYEGQIDDTTVVRTQADVGQAQRLDKGIYQSAADLSTSAKKLPDPHGSISTEWFDYTPDFGMTAAVWNGFSTIASPKSLLPVFACATGNCTWAPYASVAFCSKCNDISSRILRESGLANVDENNVTQHDGREVKPFPQTTVFTTSTATGCKGCVQNYTKHHIPELGLNISNFHGLDNPNIARQGGSLERNAMLTAKAEPNPGRTLTFGDVQTLLLSFAYLSAEEDFRNGKVRWEEAKVTAGECALYYCTNIYESRVEMGEFNETVLASWSNRVPHSYGQNSTDLANSTAKQLQDATDRLEVYNKVTNYSLYYGLLEDVNRADLQLTIPKDEAARIPGFPPDAPLTFNITQRTVASTTRYLYEDFAIRPGRDKFRLASRQLIYPVEYDERSLSPAHVIQMLGGSKDIPQTFDNVAKSMTKWIRDSSFAESSVRGVTREYVVHIRVQWKFLIPPGFCLVAGWLFILLSIWDTKRRGLPAWRGDSVAVLAFGLDGESRERIRKEARVGRLHQAARKMRVRFREYEEGPELVRLTEKRGNSGGMDNIAESRDATKA